jgi:hypothetical protein
MRGTRYLLATTLLVLAACDQDSTAARPEIPVPTGREGYAGPASIETGFILDGNGEPMEIAYEVREGRAIFEGDIDLGPAAGIARTAEQLRGRPDGPRYGVVRDGSSARWSYARVPYVIASNLPSPSRVTNAIAHIEANTGRIDFVARTNQTDYIYIRPSSGCSSSVGRVGGVQYVNLASGCSTGNTVHELLHAAGMYHEQSRCDRDSYVQILWDNIEAGYEGNFNRQCSYATDYHGYAEGSIMHYGAYAFSANGLPTIRSLRGLDSQMGQRSGMNSTDIATINTIYP